MTLDINKLFSVYKPSNTLVMGKAEDRQYYIDFSQVRGAKVINQLKRTITMSSNEPTCQLFTGHIGCGKSTELLRLKLELEAKGFHVVYFESNQILDLANVEISDILLAIVGEISKSLATVRINLKPRYFHNLFEELKQILTNDIEFKDLELSAGIAKITAGIKGNIDSRRKVRQFLEPRHTGILESINNDIIKPAQEQLKQQGKEGLVIIIDGLDKIDNTPRLNNQLQPEYLFVSRGDQLNSLKCHVVYTIPLALIYSDGSIQLKDRFNTTPKVLPMVPTKYKDNTDFILGNKLLQKMVMVRAFPDPNLNWDDWQDKEDLITQVFDSAETLSRLCAVSGGHLRSLLSLVYTCLQYDDPPITHDLLETVIRSDCNNLSQAIDNDEWELLRKASQTQSITGHEEYNTFISKLWVFEYIEKDLSWFDVNPILKEHPKFSL